MQHLKEQLKIFELSTMYEELDQDLDVGAEEVLNVRGVTSNSIRGVRGDHMPTEAKEARHIAPGEEGECKECATPNSVAAPDSTVRRMYVTRAHI